KHVLELQSFTSLASSPPTEFLGGKQYSNIQRFLFLAENLFKGGHRSRGYNNCGCPCRTYWVKKCTFKLETKCTQKYYKKECKKVPAIKSVKVKATDCQRCVRFQETVIDFSVAKECVPVYDEKCKTVYPQVCHTEEKCSMIYRTECYKHHYEQKCHQVPGKKCYNVKKCHREPQTQCNNVQRNRCRKVPQPIFKKEPSHKCDDFGPKQKDANCNGIPNQKDLVPTEQFRVKISPFNAVKLALSGINEEQGRKAVIETLGIDPELAALAQGGNPASNPAALAALAGNGNLASLLGGSGGSGGSGGNSAALAAALGNSGGDTSNLANNPAVLAALAGGGNSGGLSSLSNNPGALAALANAQGGSSSGNNQAALAALAAAQGNNNNNNNNNGYGAPRPSYGGGTNNNNNNNNQANLAAALSGQQGGTNNLAALAGQQGLSQAQIAALTGQQGGNNNNLAALAGQQGLSQAQIAALTSGQQGDNNNLAALAGQQGISQSQLAALAGQQSQGVGGLNQNQLAALTGQNGLNQNQLSALAGNQNQGRNPVTGYSPPNSNANNFNLNNLRAVAPANNYGAAVAPSNGYGVGGANLPNGLQGIPGLSGGQLPSNLAGIPGLSNGQLPNNLAGIPGLSSGNLPNNLQGFDLNSLAAQGGVPNNLASQLGGQNNLANYGNNQGAPAPAFQATSTYGVSAANAPSPAPSPSSPPNSSNTGDGTIASRFPGGVVPPALAAQIPGLPAGTLPNVPTLPPGGLPPEVAALLPPGFELPGQSQRLEQVPAAPANPTPTTIVAQALGLTNERQHKLRILQIKQRRQIRRLQDQIKRLTEIPTDKAVDEKDQASEFERDREIVTISRRERMLR
ncbi:hypothetical protein TCAL_06163, partial [Tigriopus californicus]